METFCKLLGNLLEPSIFLAKSEALSRTCKSRAPEAEKRFAPDRFPRERGGGVIARQRATLGPHSRVPVPEAVLGSSPRLASQGGLRSTSIDPL